MKCDFTSIRSNGLGICAVVGGIFIHLTLGNLYSFGNMVTYMVSFMNERVDSSISYANFIWVYAMIIFSQGLFMIVGGWLEKVVGPRVTCFTGCSIMSLGIGITYFSIQTSLGCVVLTYGFMAGFGIALAYASPLACGMKWFPTRKGLINGLIVGGFGLGSLGSTTFQTLYLNPNNEAVNTTSNYFDDPQVLDAVPDIFVLMSVVFFVLQIIGCILLNKPSDNRVSLSNEIDHLLDSDDETTEINTTTSRVEDIETYSSYRELGPRELIYTKDFYILWSIFLLNSIGIGFISSMYKSFGQKFIINDIFLSQVGALAAIFNCCGRLAWGRLMDRTTFKFSMTLLALLFSFLLLTFPITQYLSTFCFPLWVWAIFLVFSGTFVLMPTVIEKAFGQQHYCSNYGLMFTSQAISGPLLAILSQTLLSNFGYTACFTSVGVVVLGSLVLTRLLPASL